MTPSPEGADVAAGGGAVAADRPLRGVRVCELSIAIAAPTCGKYLAYFGADVVKVESDQNPDIIRLLARDTGVALGEFNAGKRSVGLDLKTPGGADAVRRLLATSDVFLTNYTAPALRRLGLDYESVAAVRPDIVYTALPGFGSDPSTPYYDFVAWGPNQAPLVGLEGLTGVPDHDPSGIATISYPDYSSGVHATVAVLAELRRRARTGAGAAIDLSQMEATVSLLGPLVLAYQRTGVAATAAGNRQPGRVQGVYPCAGADRWVAIEIDGDDEWRALAAAAGQPAWATDPRFATHAARLDNHDALDELVGAWTAQHDAAEVAHWLQHDRVASAPVADNETLALDPQLAGRRFWSLAPQARVGLDLFTGVPIRLSATPGRFDTSGPPFAEHTVEVLAECGFDDAAVGALIAEGAAFGPSVQETEPTDRPWRGWIKAVLPDLGWDEAADGAAPAPLAAAPGPSPAVAGADGADDASLAGLRVVALGGPVIGQAVRIFAGLGADVVIVEPPEGGPLRTEWAGDARTGAVAPGLWHAAFARGCDSVVADVASPDGAARVAELARTADVVLDATPRGHLDACGVGYEALAPANPGLVWVSITPFGLTGPRRDWRGGDLVAWAGSGVLYTTGHPDTPPVVPGGPALLACHLAAVNAAAGALVALAARERSGAGQLVDISMQEAAVAVACETGVPGYLSDLQHRPRQGNRRPLLRPWGLYPCTDGWASIVILQPAHWDALAAWMHERCDNETATEPLFRELITRVQTPELLDAWTEELTATYTRAELFAEGQRRGVPVTPVTTVADLLADRHLAATAFWEETGDPELDGARAPGPPWRLAGRRWRSGPAPALGHHRAPEPA